MPELWLPQTKLSPELKHFCVPNWRQSGGRGKVRVTRHSLREPLDINKHVIFTSDCRAGERAHAFGTDYWLIKDQRSIPHNAINKNVGCFFFSMRPLPHEGQGMCGKCNYLAKLRPRCAPTADHKMSSYSISSTAVPGGLGAYGSLWPSGLCQSPAHRKKGSDVTLQVRQRTKMPSTIKSQGLQAPGAQCGCNLIALLAAFFLPK